VQNGQQVALTIYAKLPHSPTSRGTESDGDMVSAPRRARSFDRGRWV